MFWEGLAVPFDASAAADTFPKLLIRNAHLYGSRPSMRHKDLGVWQTWTWSEVLEIVRAYAVGLHRLGLKRGETIAIVGSNRPKLYWSVMAAQMLGAVPVPVYADAVADELSFVLAHADVRYAAVEDQEQIDKIQSVMERLPKLERMVYDEARGLRDYDHAHLRSMNDVIADGRKALAEDPSVGVWLDAEIAASKGSDPSIILYTSGTTGFPKGAVSTHSAVCQSLMAFASGAAIQSARRGPEEAGSGLAPCFILIVPLFHVTGCIPVMMSCFAWHFKLVMMYRWEPERALQLIERHRVTSFVGVPTQSWDLLESPNFATYDTSSLTSVGGGGAPAPSKLVARVASSFSRGGPTLGYGMTETNAYGPGNYGDDYVTHPTSTGRTPTIVMDVEIRDENMKTLSTMQSGEIWMKSPTTIRCYWQKPEETAKALMNGWLRTGDLGHIDDEGYLYVEDRLKDMILRAGENVYCAEVESAIYENPNVYEAAVFGIANERLGEEVACVVKLKPGARLTEDELHTYLASRLASFKIPTRVAFTNEPLPRNPAGKFLKREMPALYFS